MTRFVWDDRKSDWVPKEQYQRKLAKRGLYVIPDTPDYISPVTGKVVSGRVQRRDDLLRHGCYEMDPPKEKRGYRNPHFALKRGLPLHESVIKSQKREI